MAGDPIGGRQAESGAFGAFGGEEGFEDAGEDIGRDAASVVLEREEDVRAGRKLRERRRREREKASLDEDVATGRHGVTGIGSEVQKDLFDLVGVEEEEREVRREIEGEEDGLAEEGLEETFDTAEDLVDVDFFESRGTGTASEGEELFGEFGTAFGGFLDQVEGLGGIGGEGGEEIGFCAGDDHRKEVVEVVGDASGEAAEGFHFLDGEGLFFKAEAFGDIAKDQGEERVILGLKGRDRGFKGEDGMVVASEA